MLQISGNKRLSDNFFKSDITLQEQKQKRISPVNKFDENNLLLKG